MRAVSGTKVLHSFTKYPCLNPRAFGLLSRQDAWAAFTRASTLTLAKREHPIGGPYNVAVPSDRFSLQLGNHLPIWGMSTLQTLHAETFDALRYSHLSQHILMSRLSNIDSISCWTACMTAFAQKSRHSLVYTCMSLCMYVPVITCACANVSIGTCTIPLASNDVKCICAPRVATHRPSAVPWSWHLMGMRHGLHAWEAHAPKMPEAVRIQSLHSWAFEICVFETDSFSFLNEHPSTARFDLKEFWRWSEVATHVETSSTAHVLHSKVHPCQTSS